MTLLELFGLIRRNIKLVVILPVVCGVLAAAFCWGFMSNVYTAETSIYALTTTSDRSNVNQGITSSDINASQQLANDFAELAGNQQIQLKAASSLGMDNLNGYSVKVVSHTTNRVIKLDVTGKDPESCARIANALATEIGDTAVEVMGVEAVNVISKATTPEVASGPNRKMYLLVAILAGLFVAIALVVLKDMLNTTIRTDEDIDELLDLPVIGHMPIVDKGGRH